MDPDWSEVRRLDGRGFVADPGAPGDDWLTTRVHPDDRSGALAAVERAIAARGAFELEHRVLRADGTTGRALTRAVPLLDGDGRITEWVGTSTALDRDGD